MSATLRARAEHAAKYGAHLVVDARDIKQLHDELDQAHATIETIKQLHPDDGSGFCAHCTRGRVYMVPAPCATAAALAEGVDNR